MPRLFARGSDGVVCIHTGSDDVVANPLLDLSRVLFHSDLLYPSVIDTIDFSVTLPARAGRGGQVLKPAAHGQPGIPFVQAYITNLGNLSVAGSLPVQTESGASHSMRLVDIGADATDLVLSEFYFCNSLAAITLDVRVLVKDLLL